MIPLNDPLSDESITPGNFISSQQQTQSQFLHEESIINSATYSTFPERYKGIDQIEILANHEETRLLMECFDLESLLNLQAIGLSIFDSVQDGTLSQLSSLLPVKVQLQSTLLYYPFILLIIPHLLEDGLIHLQLLPYAKHIPAIALSHGQEVAMISTEPFFLIKRVIENSMSGSFEKKQNELWDSLTLSVAIRRKPFKELMETIKHQPLQVEKWVQQQFWTEDQTQHILKLINGIFPLQLGLFTGLHLLFYPMSQLGQFPHLQAIVEKKLLELS